MSSPANRINEVQRGHCFAAGVDTVIVLRVARDESWADIQVRQPHGASWVKRMPLPLPEDWTRDTYLESLR